MALNKQQYEALPGKDGGERAMASEGKPIVSQPAKLSPTEEYVLNLDPATVSDVLYVFSARSGHSELRKSKEILFIRTGNYIIGNFVSLTGQVAVAFCALRVRIDDCSLRVLPVEGRGVMLGLKATQFVALTCLSVYYILRDPEAASLNDVIFLGWSVEEVNQQFLERAGLGYMAEQFYTNKINGKCLMLMNEGHLHELGITCLGDRIYLAELIGLLKKKKREAELSAAKWSGVTPAPGIAYKEDCGECCLAYFCPCCLAKTYWRVTGQGVFYKREPPCGLWMEVRTEYMDYRFFKDLELKTTRKCLCCCAATELEMYVDDHDASGAQKEGEPPNPGAFHPHVLRHPEAAQVEQIIRNSWNKVRLVAE